ncbi:MAG: hypothetical protein FJX59_11775 [Alphaproteobacteria bacterium]|nr:hypothetical protein [Alphaproteobacteria bacterium]
MTTSEPRLQHDISVHFDASTVTGFAFAPPGWPAGAVARVLRRLDGGAVRSAIVRLPPGWSSGGIVCSSTYQGFVLSGRLSISNETASERAFFARKAGRPFAALATDAGADVLMVFDSDPSFTPASSADVATVFHSDILIDVEGFTPVVNGTPVAGFARRTLWEDPDTGADMRHLTISAFEGKGPNWHPVHEEIFCLSGTIGPDDRRILRAGWYLHNPAFGVHGYHEHSHKGATLLEWHDGPWKLTYT